MATKRESTVIGVRMPSQMVQQIDAEAKRCAELHPEFPMARSTIVKMLIKEAFASRKRS